MKKMVAFCVVSSLMGAGLLASSAGSDSGTCFCNLTLSDWDEAFKAAKQRTEARRRQATCAAHVAQERIRKKAAGEKNDSADPVRVDDSVCSED